MPVSRRRFCIASASLLLAGCAGPAGGPAPRARRRAPIAPPRRDAPAEPPRAEPSERQPQPEPEPQPEPARELAAPFGQGPVIPRRRWAEADPDPQRLGPLDEVTRITVHHEGWKPVLFTGLEHTAARLETLRKAHLRRLDAGDIGYHFVVDRAGRVWEGRPLRYQGAHVKGHNEHNLGIMALGNFERQRPSPDQLGALYELIGNAMRHYGIAAGALHTHRELGPTLCPGKHLQKRMDRARRTRFA